MEKMRKRRRTETQNEKRNEAKSRLLAIIYARRVRSQGATFFSTYM